jgi:hypothetical protein
MVLLSVFLLSPRSLLNSLRRGSSVLWSIELRTCPSHAFPDWREQTTTFPLAWRGLPRSSPSARPRSSLSACCLSLSLLSLAGDSSTVASLESRHSRRPEITELAAGSKERGNLTSVALQSSPFPRQLPEWGPALAYIQGKCSTYHPAAFSAEKSYTLRLRTFLPCFQCSTQNKMRSASF